ncbi:MAG: hypothetical protein COC19_02665 [SAR86 cluster bacterium]|uniref:DUF6538 domain-containing protein n=1 Tax=SAR86 cluster bacterium TaxID=2030880 RepID=A0A2A4MR07_9GAMM|nr:MAG: hypothetical protein COC19_02665 [SAR86 cluster bacterium]
MQQFLLQKRGDNYHFRWTIPSDLRPILQRREFTKSLKTSSKIDALAKAGKLYSVVQEIKNLRRDYSVVDQEAEYQRLIKRLYEKLKKDNSPFPEDREELDKLRQHYLQMQSLLAEGTLTKDRKIPNVVPALDEMVEDFLRRAWPSLNIDFIKTSPSEYQRFMSDIYNLMGVVTAEALKGLTAETNKPELPDFLKPQSVASTAPEDASPPLVSSIANGCQRK